MAPDDDVARAYHLLARTLVTPEGCMEFLGCVQSNGYARATVRRKTDGAHRHIYRLLKGEIPDGMDVCHQCDNRKCINPAHLFLGTRERNMKDAQAKGRLGVKLIRSEVEHIKIALEEGIRPRTMARLYAVDVSMVHRIASGKAWAL